MALSTSSYDMITNRLSEALVLHLSKVALCPPEHQWCGLCGSAVLLGNYAEHRTVCPVEKRLRDSVPLPLSAEPPLDFEI